MEASGNVNACSQAESRKHARKLCRTASQDMCRHVLGACMQVLEAKHDEDTDKTPGFVMAGDLFQGCACMCQEHACRCVKPGMMTSTSSSARSMAVLMRSAR